MGLSDVMIVSQTHAGHERNRGAAPQSVGLSVARGTLAAEVEAMHVALRTGSALIWLALVVVVMTSLASVMMIAVTTRALSRR